MKWYRLAADQGDQNAQYHLGLCYEYGKGVKKDMKQAVKWYRKAAEQGVARSGDVSVTEGTLKLYGLTKGVPSAQFKLGVCYATGKGVSKDIAEARKWLQKAADRFLQLGLHARSVEARKWLQKAADRGHIDDKKALQQL